MPYQFSTRLIVRLLDERSPFYVMCPLRQASDCEHPERRAGAEDTPLTRIRPCWLDARLTDNKCAAERGALGASTHDSSRSAKHALY